MDPETWILQIEDMPGRLPERMSEDTPERMSENRSEKMPERKLLHFE